MGREARCFVFPSVWYEGSPLSVPEMQAYGIPCIVTDCSSATDTVTDGKNGFVVRANAREMAYAIRQLGEDEMVRELSEAAYGMFDGESTSEEKYVEELIRIFNEG